VKDENLMVHSAIFRPGAKPSDYQAAGENIASVQSTPAVTTARRYYKVRSGDTLGEIASRNNTTVSKLCSLNGIKPTTILQVGRQLRVK
jgi:LysM repeat protein